MKHIGLCYPEASVLSQRSPLMDRLCTKKPGRSALPALVKAGCREAAGRLVQEINILTITTPALRATPPRLRRGALTLFQNFCAKPSDAAPHSAPFFSEIQRKNATFNLEEWR